MAYTQVNFVKDLDAQKVGIKDELSGLFDKKKMIKAYMNIFLEYDYDKWNSLSREEQSKILAKAFPGMKESMADYIGKKLKTFKNLGSKRLEEKKKNGEL